jgi:hypothetical protein
LADHEIYAWRVRDERVLTSTGPSAEFHEVVVFLAGAGAAAFTAEFGKRLANFLQDLAKKMVGRYPEIGDGDALALATMRHREQAEFALLVEMTRNDIGHRVFRFADGVTIELDRHGNVVTTARLEPAPSGRNFAAPGDD